LKGLKVWREIIRVERLMPRDRQLIGISCCLVLRDQMIVVRYSRFVVRMEIRFANRELRNSVKWKLNKLYRGRRCSKIKIY
ncbi:hypothetical protein, partial [Desulfosporosinus burensis]